MTRTLLVIDDNKPVRESLQFLLTRRGYSVLVAENGVDGIALAAAHPIDGALIDVQMPGMDGFQVCRAILAQAADAGRTPAIWMMTGGRSPRLTKQALEAGALALFSKPFDFADLFRRFEQQFGGAPAHRNTTDAPGSA
jgi:CheY-like chemotaxis protein